MSTTTSPSGRTMTPRRRARAAHLESGARADRSHLDRRSSCRCGVPRRTPSYFAAIASATSRAARRSSRPARPCRARASARDSPARQHTTAGWRCRCGRGRTSARCRPNRGTPRRPTSRASTADSGSAPPVSRLPTTIRSGVDAGLLDREPGAGRTEAGRDLVDEHRRAELVAQRPNTDEEGRRRGSACRPAAWTIGSTTIAQTRCPSRSSTARISASTSAARAGRVCPSAEHAGRGHHPGLDQQRPVRRVEQLDAAERHRTQGVAVVTLGAMHVERTVLAALRRRLVGHLDRRLGRGRSVAGEEHLAQAGRRDAQQLLGRADARLVGEPEERRVVEPVELLA